MHSLPQSNQGNHNKILLNKISTKIKIRLNSETIGPSLSKIKNNTYSTF